MWDSFPLFPQRASAIAGEIDALYLALVGLSAFFSIGIFCTIFYLAVKYRQRSEGEIPTAHRMNAKLEMVWLGVPFVIAVALLMWGMSLYLRIYEPPRGAIEISVVGRQWMWKLQHPGGQAEIDELHVPAGSRILLRMATEDVIHSFFVPAFRVKQDLVPGRYTTLWFEPTRVGEYHLFCAEYCGSKHSRMVGRVVVMEPPDYQEWLRLHEPEETPLDAGARLFHRNGCASCHGEADGRRGPALASIHGSEVRLASGQVVRADDDYLRESIVDPGAKLVEGYRPLMPSYRGRVSEEDLLRLLAYIKANPALGGGKAALP
jgi:cytochrome c oxidase subunit 2